MNTFVQKIIISLAFTSFLLSSDINYTFYVDNKTPYKNEALRLDVNITQEDHSGVMLFKFNPKKNSSYDFYQISFKENEKYHALKHQYSYLIYPKTEGNVSIEFEMIKSLTDDDKVAYAISGDRDNIKGLVKKDIVVSLNPLILNVQALPLGTDLVGDYKLDYLLDRTSSQAYDPIPLSVSLKGIGMFSAFEFLPKSKKYHLFTQEPKVTAFHNRNGTQSSTTWDYAISAKESFTLEEICLKVFNPQTKKSYDLLMPSQSIEISLVDTSLLLDKVNTPSTLSLSTDWSWVAWFFSYLAVFGAGVLIPRDIWKRNVVKKEQTIEEKILSTTEEKELLKLLLSLNNKKYKQAILALERVLYHNEKIALDKIKKMT